ncbi:ATP-binding cassette domain-containing protein [Streptomyces sp. NPDC054841]
MTTSPGTLVGNAPTTPRGARLALKGVRLGHPGAVALDGLDLDVAPGEFLTVVGPSGCGKSTLLRTLAGLLRPLAGEATVDGRPITAPGAERALVFQEDALLPWRTLRANIELPLAIQGIDKRTRRATADRWLDRVGLTERARHLPHHVSGGQRQRAQLARALAGEPRVVLMDEPFGALDAQTRAGMQRLLVDVVRDVIRGTGSTVVFVTHDVDEALFLGDRVALLGTGRVLDVPRPRDRAAELPQDQLTAAHELIYRPLRNPEGPPQPQVEYKLRRFVNDYVAPPKSGARLSLAVDHFERMRTEIAEMGARTAHELMRCAEVTFIRDCAEMAARSSLARTESRWGLYHERTDHPRRDDETWLHHLDLRKSASGAMEFTARPVAPYLVPVDEYAPTGGPSRHLGEVHPEQVATAGPREVAPIGSGTGAPVAPVRRDTTTATSRSPRIVELLALAEEEQPELGRLRPYLTDPDATVRRAAVATLTETAPPGTGPALASALADPDPAVRGAAADSLRELVATLPPEPALREPLVAALSGDDAAVRATALAVLRALRLGDAVLFAPGLDDPDLAVRVETVRALVSVDAVDALGAATADPAREVRVATARGLAAVAAARAEATPAGVIEALARLVRDDDPLVRAAAFDALGATGCPSGLAEAAVEALGDGAWQVRAGAATALRGTTTDIAVPALAKALGDPNDDVRKAAVLALLRHDHEDARAALSTATGDPDADVRAYAARSVTGAAAVHR